MAYSKDVVYEEGKSGKAVRLGDYGLKLDEENLGKEYTVSAWVKPDGTLAENQNVLFLGYHNPEKWWQYPVKDRNEHMQDLGKWKWLQVVYILVPGD